MPRTKAPATLVAAVTAEGVELFIKSDYQRDFVAGIKLIPGARWNPETKVWRVPRYRAEDLAHLLAQHYDSVEWDVPDGPTAGASPLAQCYATLHLLSTAPQVVVDAAYRALAKLHHPDSGGDAAVMTHINLSYQAIRAEKKESS